MKLHSGSVVMRRVMQSPLASVSAGWCVHVSAIVTVRASGHVAERDCVRGRARDCAPACRSGCVMPRPCSVLAPEPHARRAFRKRTQSLISGPVSTSPFIRIFPQSLDPPTPIFPSAR